MGQLFYFQNKLHHPDVIYSRCSSHVSCVLAHMLSRCITKNDESCESVFTAKAGSKAGKKNQGSSMHLVFSGSKISLISRLY